MAADGTLTRAVSALTRFGKHSRSAARRFLSRCTPDEVEEIALSRDVMEYEEAVEQVLDRQERQDLTRGV